jgi:hypothetical protein
MQYNQPYVKKFDDLHTGKPNWKVLQQVKDSKGNLVQKELAIFTDRFSGESDAFKWIRNNTNVWSPNR